MALRREPFLWLHLAGLALVPLLAAVCILALAVGEPSLPGVLEWFLLAGLGVGPVLAMQVLKPFCIFALVAVALKPEVLTLEQRRLLPWFRTPFGQVGAIALSIVLLLGFWQLYRWAPLAVAVTPWPDAPRGMALLVAVIAFLGINLFTQVPLSAARVLLVSDSQLAATEPYTVERIKQDFTILGLPIGAILPGLLMELPGPALSSTEVTEEATEEVTKSVAGAEIPVAETTLEAIAETNAPEQISETGELESTQSDDGEWV